LANRFTWPAVAYQSKCDHTGNIGPTYSDHPAKVKITGQDYPALKAGLFNELIVFQVLHPLVTQADSIVSSGTQKGNCPC